ncbi:hypothetical protein [Burkholderia ubonensis]|nr:hypothetical protein [Burkholderia ubonensis]
MLLAADPGRIDREIRVARPRPRERHDPLLAQLCMKLQEKLDQQAPAAG